jgi:hypothetical protein
VSALSDLIVASNTGGLSARALSRRARELGHALNHDTAARYVRGDHGVPDEATLQAFSAVLDIPLRDLRKAASLPAEVVGPYVPPLEANRLTRRQRRAVDAVIRAMVYPTSPRLDEAAAGYRGRRKAQGEVGEAAGEAGAPES